VELEERNYRKCGEGPHQSSSEKGSHGRHYLFRTRSWWVACVVLCCLLASLLCCLFTSLLWVVRRMLLINSINQYRFVRSKRPLLLQ
jgi:hypothetical protein